MNFLFISTVLGPNVGGIETLIARMSRWLLDQGHTVTLLANAFSQSEDLLDARLTFIQLTKEELHGLCSFGKAKEVWSRLGLEPAGVIKAFDICASWIATAFSSCVHPPAKVVFGNYFPNIIPVDSNPLKNLSRRLFLLNLRRNFADQSILCMSQEQISEFRRPYGAERNPVFWPLPVEDLAKGVPPREPKWGKIVSIGRLDAMKEYNIYMLDVVANLRRRKLPVTWTVYGDGALRPAMEKRIAHLGIENAVQLMGKLDYARFAEALHDAYLFVGMGTAIVEAALCGVPGVVALAHETSGATYGPLYRFTFGNVGERMEHAPESTVEVEIGRLLNLSAQGYADEVETTRKYAEQYQMDSTMERFLELVDKAVPPKICPGLFFGYQLLSLGKTFLRPRTAADGQAT